MKHEGKKDHKRIVTSILPCLSQLSVETPTMHSVTLFLGLDSRASLDSTWWITSTPIQWGF